VLELYCIFQLCYCNNRHYLSICINDITVLRNSQNRFWNSVDNFIHFYSPLYILRNFTPEAAEFQSHIYTYAWDTHTQTWGTNNMTECRLADTALCKFTDIFPFYSSVALPPIEDPGFSFSSVIIFSQTVGLLGRVISPSQGRYLSKGQHKHRMNAYPHQTSMHCVGFEPTNPASEQTKAVHALDRAATVTA
jgi:hypothetical protein